VNPETQIIEVTCGGKQLWVAIRIEYTIDGSGRPLLDHAGRELRHSYGVVSNQPTTSVGANNAIDSILPKIERSLAEFLGSPTPSERTFPGPDVNAQLISNTRSAQGELTKVQGELATLRTSLFVMLFVAGLATILSLASIAYAYFMSRTLPELSQRMGEAEKKMGEDHKKVEAMDATLRKLVPTDGAK
jgi:hypothetical protein